MLELLGIKLGNLEKCLNNIEHHDRDYVFDRLQFILSHDGELSSDEKEARNELIDFCKHVVVSIVPQMLVCPGCGKYVQALCDCHYECEDCCKLLYKLY